MQCCIGWLPVGQVDLCYAVLYGQLLVPGPADGLPAGGQQLAEHKKQVIRYCGADCTVYSTVHCMLI